MHILTRVTSAFLFAFGRKAGLLARERLGLLLVLPGGGKQGTEVGADGAFRMGALAFEFLHALRAELGGARTPKTCRVDLTVSGFELAGLAAV